MLTPTKSPHLVSIHSIWQSLCWAVLGCSVLSDSCNPMDCSPPGSFAHRDSPAKNTGVGCHALLQGIVPIQGLNPGLLHCRRILYCHCHKGNPRIPEWVACPFSRGSPWPRSWTGVSCIAGRFFISWATREDPDTHYILLNPLQT